MLSTAASSATPKEIEEGRGTNRDGLAVGKTVKLFPINDQGYTERLTNCWSSALSPWFCLRRGAIVCCLLSLDCIASSASPGSICEATQRHPVVLTRRNSRPLYAEMALSIYRQLLHKYATCPRCYLPVICWVSANTHTNTYSTCGLPSFSGVCSCQS